MNPSRRIGLVVGIAAVIAVVAFAAAYLASPFFAAKGLGDAVRNKDRDALADHIDFPAVRDGLKDQFGSALTRHIQGDKSLRGNPIAGLAILVATAIIDKAVEAIVTPDGIADLLKQPMTGVRADPSTKAKKWDWSWSYVDRDHFRSNYTQRSDPNITFALMFVRRGLFTWKLVRLDLPLEEIIKRSERRASLPKSAKFAMRSPSPAT